jgi:hypothetical protein
VPIGSSRRVTRAVVVAGAVVIAVSALVIVVNVVDHGTKTPAANDRARVAPAFSTSGANALCSAASSATRTIGISSGGTASTSSISAAFEKLRGEEPLLEREAPPVLRGDFRVLFSYANAFYGVLSRYGWNLARVPEPTLGALESSANQSRIATASSAVAAFLSHTCGITQALP